MTFGLRDGQNVIAGDPDVVISAFLCIAAVILVAAAILIRRSARSRTMSEVWSGRGTAWGFVLTLDAVMMLGVAIALLVL